MTASRAGVPRARGAAVQRWIAAHITGVLATLLALATLILYARSARFEFVNFDDGTYVWSNPDLSLGLSWAGLRYAFTAHDPYWHPLVWLINLTVYSRFGVKPGPYHVVNFCFQAAAGGLLLLFWARATGNRWAAALAAAVWAWHPLRVESVVWIAETKDVSAGFFWILGMLLYVNYIRRPSGWRYAGVTAAYACALCCKPSVVTFPFALLLLDCWPLRRWPLSQHAVSPPSQEPAAPVPWRTLMVEKLPWAAMAAAVSAGSYWAQRTGRAMTNVPSLPPAARLENGAVAYLWYVGKTFWPTRLAVFYPHPYMLFHRIAPAQWIASAAALAAITVVAAALWRSRPAVIVGWLWFLGTMVPMIGLVQVGLQSKADRHTLIPSIGLIAAIVFPLGELLQQRPPIVRRMAGFAVGVVLAAELVATWMQVGTWRNTRTLFAHANAVVPSNFLAASILAQEYAADPATRPQAQALAEQSVREAPDQALAHQALGFVYETEDNTRAALREFEQAAHLNPQSVIGCDEVGREEVRLGRYDRALLWYGTALKLSPGDVTAQHNIALCLAHQGHLDEAIAKWRVLLLQHPGYDVGHTRLAEALQRRGDLHGAAEHYRAAVALGEKDPTVEANYAWCVATDPQSTAEQTDQVLPIAKDAAAQTAQHDPLALDALAAALARAGQFDDAAATAARAVQIAADKPALARAITQREADYRAGRPYLINGR